VTIASPPPIAFDSDDANAAYEAWGCNCGPSALAACLGWTLDAVRPHLMNFEAKGFMSPTMMIGALTSAGFDRLPRSLGANTTAFPRHGLVRIQWGGPWLSPGVSPRAAYRYTHWVASKRISLVTWVFDVNGGWLTFDDWSSGIVPMLIASIKRADGTWTPTHCWEVRRAS
jgi:hypothetical protein